MMKDVRKTLLTFWSSQFLQGAIFEDFHKNQGFPAVWVFLTCSVHFFMQETVVNTQKHNRSELHIIFLLTCVFRGSPSQMYLWVWSVAVNGRVLRTSLGHDVCSCHEQSRYWHGRGIIKFEWSWQQHRHSKESRQRRFALLTEWCEVLFSFFPN